MRRLSFFAAVLILVCVMCQPVFAGYYDDGTVVYRQSFSDVSTPENAGVKKGERNFDGFSLSVSNEALFIDCYSDTRSFALLPYYNDLDDYTIEASFSLKNIRSQNAYFSLMLTSIGNNPDNVTDVTVRPCGKCGQFGELDSAIAERITAGEKVYITIPVKHGMLSTVTVSVGGRTQTLTTGDVKDVLHGFPGFIVRNASAYVYDITVTVGTSFNAKNGSLADTSAYTDQMPYVNYIVSTLEEPLDYDDLGADVGVYELSPFTGDMIVIYILLVTVSAVAVIILMKKRK